MSTTESAATAAEGQEGVPRAPTADPAVPPGREDEVPPGNGVPRGSAVAGSAVVGANGKPVGLPHAVRALATILAVDFALGLWLALHGESHLTTYLAPQVPALGLAAFAWGFLPEDTREAVGLWITARLERRWVFGLAITVGVGALVASLFVSTIVVESTEPSASTRLRVVRGSAVESDVAEVLAIEAVRLNRATSPAAVHVATHPLGGARYWLHTDERVSTQDVAVIPWIPTRLRYPDDFDEMAAIEVLPEDLVLTRLGRGDVYIEIEGGDGGDDDLIVRTDLPEGSLRLAFVEPPALGAASFERWREILRGIEPDPDYVEPMMDAWRRTRWVPFRRPVRVGQTVRFTVRTAAGETLREAEELTLNDATTPLVLTF